MDDATRAKLVADPVNICLVGAIARRMAPGLPRGSGGVDEAKAEAMLGLIRAAKKFNPDIGKTFKTFSAMCAENAIKDLIRREWTQRRAIDGDRDMKHVVSSASSGPDPDARAAHVREQIKHSGLSANELLIVRLMDLEEMTVGEASAATGFHQSKVKRLHAEAMSKLWFNPHLRDLYHAV